MLRFEAQHDVSYTTLTTKLNQKQETKIYNKKEGYILLSSFSLNTV